MKRYAIGMKVLAALNRHSVTSRGFLTEDRSQWLTDEQVYALKA